MAFTKKGLLPLLLRKSSRTNVTPTIIRRAPRKRNIGLEASSDFLSVFFFRVPHLLLQILVLIGRRSSRK